MEYFRKSAQSKMWFLNIIFGTRRNQNEHLICKNVYYVFRKAVVF